MGGLPTLFAMIGLMLALATGSAPAQAQEAAPALPVEQVEKIVRDYLLREPEIVYQALQELQRRQQAAKLEQQKAAIASHRAKLVEDPADPVAGAEQGVTLVEFFDYRCTYCRRVVDSLQALLKEQPDLRVVFKEFPVLGEDSMRAAKAALASQRQDRYVPFHFALMHSDDLSLAGIRATAESVGLDPDRLERDMEAPEIGQVLERNYMLASALGIEGTPAFVIGDELIPGAIDKARMAELIEQARTGCVSC
jgi:protein-disulfide isomerase